MIRGGWSGTGARGGGRRIRARIAGGGATLRCTGLFALALVAIVETNVRSDTLCDGTVDHLAVRAVLSDVAGLEAPVAAQDECRVCRLDLGRPEIWAKRRSSAMSCKPVRLVGVTRSILPPIPSPRLK